MLELAVLGLLQEQPRHGYELKKRLGDELGFLWGVSYGSLYPALKRLQRAGAIEEVDPGDAEPPTGRPASFVPPTGSLAGEAAAARLRRPARTGRRTRKAYRITDRGRALFAELLDAEQVAGADDDRSFALKLAFCRFLTADRRIDLFERRRAALLERLGRTTRKQARPANDRYLRSLADHRARVTELELEWVEGLINEERDRHATASAPSGTTTARSAAPVTPSPIPPLAERPEGAPA